MFLSFAPHARELARAAALGALAVLTVAGSQPAAAADIDVTSKISAVQVYPSGAEVTRRAKARLEKGDHIVVLGDLPAQAVPGSIRVEAKATGQLRIGSVDSRRLFVARDDALRVASERQALEDKIQSLKDDRTIFEGRIQAAQTQRTLIGNLANLPNRPPAPSGQGTSSQHEDWSGIMALIGASMADVSQAILDAEIKIRELTREITDLEKELSQLVPRRTERTQVKVFVSAQTPLEADLVIRYQVPRASWTPYYDARLKTGTKTEPPKIELTRRATITQHSGENWDEVAMTLSTTRPTAGAAPPVLQPMSVDFVPEYKPPPRPMPMAESAPAVGMAMDDAERDDGYAELRAAREPVRKALIAVENSTSVETSAFQALFHVPGKVSVASTGEAKRVQVSVDTLEPELSIRTVPRRDPKAYLLAKIKVPKGAPLLAGHVSLIRDGTFVGTGNLPLLVGDEDHDLGFGVDDLVRVRHDLVKDNKGETGLIASSRTETRIYRMALKNLHERAIAYEVHDQLPVSKDEDIIVERRGKSAPTKSDVDNKRGILAWSGNLEPDEEQVIEFGYRVSWPGSRNIRYGR